MTLRASYPSDGWRVRATRARPDRRPLAFGSAPRVALGKGAAPVPEPVEPGVAFLHAQEGGEVGTGHGPPGLVVVGPFGTLVVVLFGRVVVVVVGFLGLMVVGVGGGVVGGGGGGGPVPRPSMLMY